MHALMAVDSEDEAAAEEAAEGEAAGGAPPSAVRGEHGGAAMSDDEDAGVHLACVSGSLMWSGRCSSSGGAGGTDTDPGTG